MSDKKKPFKETTCIGECKDCVAFIYMEVMKKEMCTMKKHSSCPYPSNWIKK
jgi:hypothetical protein